MRPASSEASMARITRLPGPGLLRNLSCSASIMLSGTTGPSRRRWPEVPGALQVEEPAVGVGNDVVAVRVDGLDHGVEILHHQRFAAGDPNTKQARPSSSASFEEAADVVQVDLLALVPILKTFSRCRSMRTLGGAVGALSCPPPFFQRMIRLISPRSSISATRASLAATWGFPGREIVALRSWRQ